MKFSLNDFKKSLVNNSTILLSFFSHPDLLKWTRDIVDASTNATPYDDKVDEVYIQTKIGGGNHRLFDESHTLGGIFEKVRETYPDDNLFQEILASVSVWFKDVTTPAGMPFINIDDKISYDASKKWFVENIPGSNPKWFDDFHTYDVGEIFTSSFGIACAVFSVKKNDRKKLEEILGQMSILSILSANPLMGVSVVFITFHQYFLKSNSFNFKNISKGAFKQSFGLLIVSILGPTLFIQLIAMLVIYKIFRMNKEFIFENIIFIWNKYLIKNFNKNSILLLERF